jgi:hypothetical protein
MKCKRYTIKGKNTYSVLVDPRKTIIDCKKFNENLLFKDFSLIFEEYKDKAYFTYEGEEEYPLLVEEEILDEYKKKNPVINKLIEKFDLTL